MRSENTEDAINDSVNTAAKSTDLGSDYGSLQSTWHDIETSLTKTPFPQPNAAAYLSWIRWLRLIGNSSDAGELFCEDQYWRLIQHGLRASSAEQRKYCLYILSRSIALLDKNVNTPRMACPTGEGQKEIFQEAYERYCTLYSTLVLNRYINQVEECLPDLQELATPYGSVDPSWIIVLLGAVLENGVQDSVRKAVGTSFMNWDLMTFPATDVWFDFLVHSFLPWACQGNLLISTIINDRSGEICQHGESLSSFIDRLVHLCEDEQAMIELFRHILGFIQENAARLIPHAGAYLLDGLLRGFRSMVEDGADLQFGAREADLALKVASQSTLPDVARDFYRSRCKSLLELARNHDPEHLQQMLQARRISLDLVNFNAELRFMRISADAVDANSKAMLQLILSKDRRSMSSLMELIESTKHKCLQGEGLVVAQICLRDCLDLVAEADTNVLVRVLSAIWSEMEIQDYPKTALTEVPSTFFHGSLLDLCTSSTDLQDLIRRTFETLQHFSSGRVYVFSALMKTVHQTYLQSPSRIHVLPFRELVFQFSNYPPRTKVEFQLESALARLLQRDHSEHTYIAYYGDREGVAYAALFDIINRLGPEERDLGISTLRSLLQRWMTQPQPVPMVSKWKTTIQIQVMLVMVQRCFSNHIDPKEGQEFLEIFHDILALEPLPRYRYLLEWINISLTSRMNAPSTELLKPLRLPEHENPKYLASLIRIGVQVARLPNASEEFGLQLMTALVPACASPKIAVRHEAQWSFFVLWDHAEGKDWRSLLDNVAFKALNDYIRCLDRYGNPRQQRLLENFDILKDNTLMNLFQGNYLKIAPGEKPVISKEDFETVWARSSQRSSIEADMALPLGDAPLEGGSATSNETPNPKGPSRSSAEPAESRNPLQTKAASWETFFDLPSSGSSHRIIRPITVFASHIAFPYNLGGISRASEIFGAEAFVVAKADIVKDRQFLNVSVNSNLHLPIVEVPPDEKSVRHFLKEKRQNGYGVVGVEQTDRSVVLGGPGGSSGEGGSKVLPEKCVLVMGSEKEGIPGWLLAECDVCVEIPQVGVTRSLNVQTAAAVVLYEYGREWGGVQK